MINSCRWRTRTQKVSRVLRDCFVSSVITSATHCYRSFKLFNTISEKAEVYHQSHNDRGQVVDNDTEVGCINRFGYLKNLFSECFYSTTQSKDFHILKESELC